MSIQRQQILDEYLYRKYNDWGMGILRFPNPVSDIKKFWVTYKTLFGELETVENFDNYDIRKVMIDKGLVSSCGATGEEALTRSTREDTTRDPLYNQAKMYSELYRALGWMHPGKDRTHFVTTTLGSFVARKKQWLDAKDLVIESVKHMVYPNPNVTTLSDNNIRPFPFTLKLMESCDGLIFRDELILAVLCVDDDRHVDALSSAARLVEGLRGDVNRLREELRRKAGPLQENTLQNYTRFPLGVLKTSGWAEEAFDRAKYGRSMKCYKLTDYGRSALGTLSTLVDIRASDIRGFSTDERLSFLLLSSYAFSERAGYNLDRLNEELTILETRSAPLLRHFGIANREQIMYSPYQQNSREDIKSMDEYEEENFG